MRHSASKVADVEAVLSNAVVRALGGWLERELQGYARALRQLAYSLPNGVGERELLQLSEQMNTVAGTDLAEQLAAVELTEAGAGEVATEPAAKTIEEIREVIPDWPDTDGVPWQICEVCRVVFDPAASRPHDHFEPAERFRGTLALEVVPQVQEELTERFGIDMSAASALLQKLSIAADASVEHIARLLVRSIRLQEA